MKKILPLVLASCLLGLFTNAQFSRYIIKLTDKQNTPYSFNQPGKFLSAKSLDRRNRYKISLDSTDLPITPSYLDSIQKAGAVVILNKSKWLNQVAIQTTDSAALAKILGFPFVKPTSGPIALRKQTSSSTYRNKFNEQIEDLTTTNNRNGDTVDYFNYGLNDAQIRIHHGEFLHNQGFHGEGMTIAILDAGFYQYMINPLFDSLRAHNQILGTWDFVKNEASVNEDDKHGMYCLSIIAANSPGTMVGTCPKANFYLFRTEDAASEYPIEEQNWVAAAELADSLGVDLITSSLGYSEFDDPIFNHTYADMNGHTTIISNGADLAARKGILITNSAGNSGQDAWHYIIAPADADSILAVGAVNSSKQVAPFSSYGPSSDGRIKPNVASVGWGTIISNAAGVPVSGSGTSFSNPNLAGLVTCLWQAFPEFSNVEIIDAVQKSADHYTNPDDRVGYGIPDFELAYQSLEGKRKARQGLSAYPVPFKDQLTVNIMPTTTGIANLQLINASGQLVQSRSLNVVNGQYQILQWQIRPGLSRGVYFLVLREGTNKHTISVIK